MVLSKLYDETLSRGDPSPQQNRVAFLRDPKACAT